MIIDRLTHFWHQMQQVLPLSIPLEAHRTEDPEKYLSTIQSNLRALPDTLSVL